MPVRNDEQLDKFIADLWVAMTRIIKNTRHPFGRLAEDHDLTQQQLYTLWQLQEHGPMTMGALAELLSVTHGVATRMVDRLLKKGMVERNHNEKDRRVVLISLSRLGARVTAEVLADTMSVIKSAFKNVPQRDRERYLVMLGRIEEAQSGGPDG